MNTTGNKSHDQDRTPPRGLPRSFRPHVPCPETVLVVVMTDNSYVLVGYPQGQPTALVTAPDAGSLHQALTEAFGPAHPTDQSASRNGTGTNTSSDRSRTRAAGQPRWEANLNPSLPGTAGHDPRRPRTIDGINPGARSPQLPCGQGAL